MRISAHVDPRRAAQHRSRGYWGDVSLYDHWRASAGTHPDKIAVKDSRGTALTYRDVDDQAARLARYLRGRGVGAGDVVSLQLPNWAQFVVADVACLKLGAVVNPVLSTYRWAELSHILALTASRALVMPAQFRSFDYLGLARQVLTRSPDCPAILIPGPQDDAALPSLAEAVTTSAPLPESECTPGRGSDVAAVLFTSGTEGVPKGVLLSHDNVIFAEKAYAERLDIGARDRVFTPAPVGHATGYQHGVTLAFMVGGTCLLLDVVEPNRALRMINDEGATCGQAVSRVVEDLLDASDRSVPLSPALRFLCCGGSAVPRRLVGRARRSGVRLYSVYGSTESTPHAMTGADDSDERVLSTDGRPVPGVEIRIVNPHTRAPVAPGVEGEEESRGPQIFLGYLGRPELTARAIDGEGWYRSGDLAVMDEDGYIRITGRIKDTILRGGENISALEVEAVLRECPGVADVAVVAMPDERMGQCACAFVVMDAGAPRLTLAGLRKAFAEAGVAAFKTPERLEFVTSLPLTPSGKVRKTELRTRIAAVLEAERGVADGSSTR